MSLVTPPQTLAVGTATAIKPPANSPWAAVVIQNLSPYLLEVQAGSQVAWLAPFTSDLFSPGPTQAPVALTPQAIAGALASNLGGAQVQATWYNPDEAAALQATYPTSLPGSAVLAATAPPGLVFGPTAIPIPVSTQISQVVSAPSTTRTLYVVTAVSGGAGPASVGVTGAISGTTYRAQTQSGTGLANAPYLPSTFGAGEGVMCVVPVAGAVDTSFIITASAPQLQSPITMEVYADTVTTLESSFYNGTAQGVADAGGIANGIFTVAAGPCRLLNCSLVAANGATGIMLLSGKQIMRLDNSGTTNDFGALAFPENTIIPLNELLQVQKAGNGGAAFSAGGAVIAYP